jgi:hypothetical protein
VKYAGAALCAQRKNNRGGDERKEENGEQPILGNVLREFQDHSGEHRKASSEIGIKIAKGRYDAGQNDQSHDERCERDEEGVESCIEHLPSKHRTPFEVDAHLLKHFGKGAALLSGAEKVEVGRRERSCALTERLRQR